VDRDLPPSVPGINSLLGTGRQNLLRTKDTVYCHRSLKDYCTRLHGVSLPDSRLTKPTHNLGECCWITHRYGFLYFIYFFP